MSPDISRQLQSGLEHHQSGRLSEAEAIYQSIIKSDPENADAWNLLGILAQQTGNAEASEKCIATAIRLDPENAEYVCNYAEAFAAQKNYDEAIKQYEKAIAINPTLAGAHNNLGNIYRATGNLKGAIDSYRQAIACEPGFAMAYNNLGICAKEQGQAEQAVDYYEKAISITPAYPEAHNNLGNALQDLGRNAKAIQHYQKALELVPGYAEAFSNMGNALRKVERPGDAIKSYEKALAINPGFAMAHYNLGVALDEMGEPAAAVQSYEKAIAIEPNYADAHNNLGFSLQELGKRDAAISAYRKTLELQADYAAAHMHLSMIVPSEDDIPVIESLLEAPSIDTIDASHLHFALGNIHNSLENYDRAFEHYQSANTLKRSRLDYDPADFSAYVDDLIQVYSKDYFSRTRDYGSASTVPVFIIGLPRSGSTLIEQILSSHPRVYGAGELLAIARMQRKTAENFEMPGPYPKCMERVTSKIACDYAAAYLREIARYSTDVDHVTDKDPGNFHRIGLIRTLFPAARIIHCQRNAAATCLSLYFNYFAESNEYSFDLRELGQYYLDYQRLMQHWSGTLEDDILHVRYEDLVADQGELTRQLLNYLDLPWDPGCLDFHLNKRAVRTASSVQVRQPLYNKAVNRWKNYAKHLGPLLDTLALENHA